MNLVEQGSEVQFGRYSTSQIPKYRNTNPRNLSVGGISQPIRRKHIAESYGSGSQVAADHEYNESSLPFRQRTNSPTPVESIRLRNTCAKLKNDTDVVATEKSRNNSAITPTSSSIKQKPSFQSIPTLPDIPSSTSLSLSTADAKGPQKKKIKKGGSGPVPKQLPTILNVGRSSPLSQLFTLPSTTTTRSAFALDATSPLDMDTLPSIPSPPKSPTSQNNTATTVIPNANLSYPSSPRAPFSTPYDEDSLLENEIPFPLNKHSNIIIENMGIKKAKKTYKGKESLLNRHITTVRPELPPCSDSTLPLPLRSPCQHKATLSPPTGIPFYDTFSPSTTSEVSASPLSSRKDAWGCMHLGADDYELSIAFPQTSHYEVWDMDDDAFFACPAFLCLMAKDPRIWTGTPISLPDVSLIDIRCDDHPVPNSMSVYDPSVEYGTQCVVPRKNAWNRNLSSSQMPGSPFTVDHKEITIDGKWERTYTKPEVVDGPNQTQILHIAERNGNGTTTTTGRGWYLKIWIPIPARLFTKRETRIFEIRASVWMVGDEEYVLRSMDLEEVEEELPLIAEAEMTVSHLRREREMMK